MILSKQRLSLLGLGVFAVVTAWAALALFAAAWAHADAGSPTPSPGLDIASIVVGVVAVMSVASLILHFVAPRTKNTVDDALRDDIDEILAYIRSNQIPLPAATTIKAPPVTLLAVLALGLAVTQPSCAEVRPRVAAVTEAFVDCELPALKVAATEAYDLAEAALLSTISGTGSVDSAALKRALVGIKSDGLRCAVAAAVAGIATPANQPQGLMAARSDATGMRNAYAVVSGELGWPTYRVGPP